MLLSKTTWGDGGGLAVWQITEREDELLSQLSVLLPAQVLKQVEEGISSLRNPTRRQEWLAVRMLVALCLGSDKTVCYEPSGRPCIGDGSCEISISHTKGYAALVWHPTLAVGVDVERRTDRVMRVVRKFVNDEEQTALDTSHFVSPDGELLLWTAKEALYKAVGIRELDCLHALTVAIPPAGSCRTTACCDANQTTYEVCCSFSPEFVLSHCYPV